jgi:hypothetical protein
MTGGNWETQNKVRPGAYINFKTNKQDLSVPEATGAVIIPLSLDWGETGKFVEVTQTSKVEALLGKGISQLIPLREAFKATNKVFVYNLSGAAGVKATKASGTFTVTAKHGGSDGNKIVVTVTVGLDTFVTVKTLFDGIEVDSQKVKTLAELVANSFVTFSGTALPGADTTITLAGGTTIAATNASYSELSAKLDTQEFRVLAVSTSDASIKLLLALRMKELRSVLGKNVTLVVNDYNTADHESAVSVLNGVTLEGNEALTASQSLYWYAAAYANARDNSLTYASYPGAIDCERKTHDEIVKALNDGHIIFTINNGEVVVEQDINTFRSFTREKNKDFRKNKIVRTMDLVANDIQYVYSKYFIGKVDSDENGRNLFKGQIMKLVLDGYQKRGKLQYEADDIIVEQGTDKDSVVVLAGVLFNDAMEKLYMTVACK